MRTTMRNFLLCALSAMLAHTASATPTAPKAASKAPTIFGVNFDQSPPAVISGFENHFGMKLEWDKPQPFMGRFTRHLGSLASPFESVRYVTDERGQVVMVAATVRTQAKSPAEAVKAVIDSGRFGAPYATGDKSALFGMEESGKRAVTGSVCNWESLNAGKPIPGCSWIVQAEAAIDASKPDTILLKLEAYSARAMSKALAGPAPVVRF